MQIKTFSAWDWADVFQDKINFWLNENEGLFKIIDIKYSTTVQNDHILFSAIIIYMKKSNEF